MQDLKGEKQIGRKELDRGAVDSETRHEHTQTLCSRTGQRKCDTTKMLIWGVLKNYGWYWAKQNSRSWSIVLTQPVAIPVAPFSITALLVQPPGRGTCVEDNRGIGSRSLQPPGKYSGEHYSCRQHYHIRFNVLFHHTK